MTQDPLFSTPNYPFFPAPVFRIDPSSFHISKLENPQYLRAVRLNYREGDFSKHWEVLEPRHSVCILIYHQDFDSFDLVRQFRPAVFYVQSLESQTQDLSHAYTYELCAGLVDKEGKSLEQIAREEVLEECGFKAGRLTPIQDFLGNTGNSGARTSIFFTQVGQKDRVSGGGGVDDECIEVLYLKKEHALDFIFHPKIAKTTSLFLAIHWYYYTFTQGK